MEKICQNCKYAELPTYESRIDFMCRCKRHSYKRMSNALLDVPQEEGMIPPKMDIYVMPTFGCNEFEPRVDT